MKQHNLISFNLSNPLKEEEILIRHREHRHHNMIFRRCRVQCDPSNLRRTTGETVGLKKPSEGGRKPTTQAQAQMARYNTAPGTTSHYEP